MWPENYSANSAQKVWAARVSRAGTPTSRFSTCRAFKCGHDAPTYGIVDKHHQDGQGAVFAALHDLDANKPGGSILIRVQAPTIHKLKLVEEELEDRAKAEVGL